MGNSITKDLARVEAARLKAIEAAKEHPDE
jgi:hypothetical protein